MALAAALRRAGCRRAVARQDAQAWQSTAAGGDGGQGAGADRAPSRPAKPPIGPAARWPRRSASACARCSASGRRTVCSRTASAPSSAPTIPAFAEKVEDIVGLYMNPPAHAVVVSIDEKIQIQALDRTQPGLPMKPGKCGTMTHDYKRNGTTTLFAALNILDGTVIGRCMPTPHPPGVHPLPQRRRARRAGRQDDPRHPRQLRHPQASQGQAVARRSSALDLPLHPDLGFLAQRRRGLLLGHHPPTHPTRRLPIHRRPRRTPSHRYIREHNRSPSPSSGPNQPTPSSPSSTACLYLPNEPVH